MCTGHVVFGAGNRRGLLNPHGPKISCRHNITMMKVPLIFNIQKSPVSFCYSLKPCRAQFSCIVKPSLTNLLLRKPSRPDRVLLQRGGSGSRRSSMAQCHHTCEVDAEPVHRYKSGGYHPIHLGDSMVDGRYKIIHKLGWGANSTVWAARDQK